MYTGNSAQRFYNAASRMYYGWEANSHDEDQMLYFKVAVSPTEINIFFRCILCLNGSYYVIRQVNYMGFTASEECVLIWLFCSSSLNCWRALSVLLNSSGVYLRRL